ncbi:MAG: hypothetical protein K2X28_08625, partial [Alphaproteobacteria bacterium]|nr:hypothetical protein [Alphaproteobacteria bacterium]
PGYGDLSPSTPRVSTQTQSVASPGYGDLSPSTPRVSTQTQSVASPGYESLSPSTPVVSTQTQSAESPGYGDLSPSTLPSTAENLRSVPVNPDPSSIKQAPVKKKNGCSIQ